MTEQYYSNNGITVRFIDKKESIYSAKCQPRDIVILDNVENPKEWQAEICIEIRRNCGLPEIGIAKNLKWEAK